MILETKKVLEDQGGESDEDKPMHLLHPLFSTHVEKEDWRRNSIFQTQFRCNGQLCSMVIDEGSCTNVVSKEAMKNLGLKTKPNPSPYKMAQVNNTSLKVSDKCLLTYSIRGFIDKIRCDILPLKVSHHTWKTMAL